ncbi:MAG: S24/S26 family peptidase [Bacteroidaceae bacterium]|nr:S24/S26 family peptidase [Bacteroidaceae bacterium]
MPNDAFLGLVSETLTEGHTAVIWVKGYSMRPFIEFGRDKVKLVSAATYQVGDAVLAEIAKGHYVLHRIIKTEGNKLTLQGDGNVKGVEYCTMADVRGVVTEYIRPNRTLSADDASLKRKIRLWRMLRPIRRELLFIYKVLI